MTGRAGLEILYRLLLSNETGKTVLQPSGGADLAGVCETRHGSGRGGAS